MVSEKNRNKSFIKFLVFSLFLTFTIIVLFVVIFSDNSISDDTRVFRNTWSYSVAGNDAKLLNEVKKIEKVDVGDEIRLKNRLIDMDYISTKSIMFQTDQQNVTVLIDNNIVYESTGKPGIRLNVIELRHDYLGKDIEVILSSPYSNYSGKIPEILIGNTKSILSHIVAEASFDVIIAFYCLILTLMSLYGFSIFALNKEIDFYFLHYALLSLTLAFLFPMKQKLYGIIFEPATISYFFYLLQYVQPALISYLIMKLSSKSNRKQYMKLLIIVDLIFFIVAVFTEILGIFELASMYSVYQILIVLNAAIICVISIKDIKVHNDIMSLGLVFSMFSFIFVIADNINFHYCLYNQNLILHKYAILGFVTCYGMLYFSRFMYSIFSAKTVLELNTDLKTIAYSDKLTNLGNRMAFDRKMNKLNRRKSMFDEDELAIIVFDLNKLKYVNDTFGHAIGDQYISLCADCFREVFIDKDNLFRIGGDEFVVILEYVSRDDLRSQIRLLYNTFTSKSHGDLQLSVAYGFEYFNNYLDSDIYETFERADKKMYMFKAKQKKEENFSR